MTEQKEPPHKKREAVTTRFTSREADDLADQLERSSTALAKILLSLGAGGLCLGWYLDELEAISRTGAKAVVVLMSLLVISGVGSYVVSRNAEAIIEAINTSKWDIFDD